MKTAIVSCHAASTGTTFRHSKDLWINQFDYATLHNGLASSVLKYLKKCGGSIVKAQILWDQMRTGGKVRANTYFFKAGSNILDYKLWYLGDHYADVNGIFDFSDFDNKIEVNENQQNAKKLSALIDDNTSNIIWLACAG